MRNRRSIFLTAVMALTLTGSLAACGGDSADIARTIDAAQPGEADNSAVTAAQVAADQRNADEDARDAERARERRQELAQLEKEQAAETKRIMEEGVPGGNEEDATIPIGSADPEVERFRARLAGVCAGGQKSILKVSDDAKQATKSKDPAAILEAAQAYSGALNNFLGALNDLDAPTSMKADYRAWLTTINDLAANVRLQLVSQSDTKKAKALQAKTQELTTDLLEKSAILGVTCLSTTG